MIEAVRRELGTFSSKPILSWIDPDGHPASTRVDVDLDGATGVVRIRAPAAIDPHPGPASLCSHFLNERMWDLRMVLFRGELRREGDGFVFVPKTQVGSGKLRLKDFFGFIKGARQAAASYLAKRGLERPRIPWDQVARLKNEAKRLGID